MTICWLHSEPNCKWCIDADVAMDKLIDTLVISDPQHWANGSCSSCHGKGKLPGGTHEFWGFNAPAGEYTCDCPFETAGQKVFEMLQSGELTLEYDTDGKPFVGGAYEAGLL